jgi:hypothetical protein
MTLLRANDARFRVARRWQTAPRMNRSSLLFAALAAAALPLACGSSSGADDGLTAEERAHPCEADCDRQVAAACLKTPAGYADGCKQLCGASKASIPTECQAKFDAMYTCVLRKITYACTASGVPIGSPSGACAAEGSACIECNGGKLCSVLTPGG